MYVYFITVAAQRTSSVTLCNHTETNLSYIQYKYLSLDHILTYQTYNDYKIFVRNFISTYLSVRVSTLDRVHSIPSLAVVSAPSEWYIPFKLAE